MLPKFAPVDMLLVTGDITHDGDAESYREFGTQIERLGLPYRLIPGNHDNRETLRSCFGDLDHIPGQGPLNWAEDLGHIRVIGVDTLIDGATEGALGEETIGWLTAQLAATDGRPTMIAMHHPPIDTGIRSMDRIGLRDREALKPALAAAQGEVTIVCGHVHRMFVGSIFGRTVITAPSAVNVFDADFRDDAPKGFFCDPGGFMLHDWSGGFRSTPVPLIDGDGPYPFRPAAQASPGA
jgi:3',5'-cyclic AMP phosphodiesterase CpdA